MTTIWKLVYKELYLYKLMRMIQSHGSKNMAQGRKTVLRLSYNDVSIDLRHNFSIKRLKNFISGFFFCQTILFLVLCGAKILDTPARMEERYCWYYTCIYTCGNNKGWTSEQGRLELGRGSRREGETCTWRGPFAAARGRKLRVVNFRGREVQSCFQKREKERACGGLHRTPKT